MPLRRISLLAVLVAATTVAAAICRAGGGAAATSSAPAVFDPAAIDFGILKPGQVSSIKVQVRSLVDRPLKIVKAATCSCIEVRFSSTTIQPRSVVYLEAIMTPKAGLGDKREKIQLGFAGEGETATIDVHAEVSLPIRMRPGMIDATEVMSGVIEVSSLDEKPFRVLRTAGVAPSFVDFNPASDQPRNRYQLRWDLSQYSRQTMPWWWVIETDRDDAAILDARIMHEWTRPVRAPDMRSPSDQRIVIGVLKPGQTFDFTTRVQWGHHTPRVPSDAVPAGTLQSVKTASSQFAVELVKTQLVDRERQTDLECTVRITASPGKPGLIYGPVTYTTPDGFADTWMIIGRLEE